MFRTWVSVCVLLVFTVASVGGARSGGSLRRQRRHWILPPTPLKENVNYTHKEYIAKIRSDFDTGSNLVYSLEGVGASKFPFHVFVVDAKSGKIRVTKILDREYIHTYNLSGVATFLDGRLAERNIDLQVKVVDENDNAPVFGEMKPVDVFELSATGTSVMKLNATDADEPSNVNSKIAYSIIEQKPNHDMFDVSRDGTIFVKKSTLDREAEDQYILTVKGQDLNGQPGGHSGIGTVIINVLDVNDNLPTLENEQYEGSIVENTHGVEVMRIKAEDLDVRNTDNWEAVFDIVKGNEAGYFSIKTDPKTNEGILMLDKAVDYEDTKTLDLGLAVRNKAPPFDESATGTGAGIGFGGGSGGGGGGGSGGGGSGGGGSGGGGTGSSGTSGNGVISGSGGSTWQSGTLKTYPIKINVKNQPEGPHFDPKVKAIPISEGGHTIDINSVITRYAAIDGDTLKPAENVRYAKGSDPDNWLTIDPKTADIKLNKMPDRESPVLVNGTYMAQILCISEDMPGKTATGTIAIQVQDFNDQCPVISSEVQTLCTTKSAVIVNAIDEDAYPNGPPFDFVIIPEGTEGKWNVEHYNDTAAILRAQESMWPGLYQVEVMVRDQQGEACPETQKVMVQVCTCEDGVMCGKKGANGQPSKGAKLGPAGIGLLFLGLLLLLLIPLLLLFCRFGGTAGFPDLFTPMPFDPKPHLINYHTERQGENTEVPLLNMPTQVDGDALHMGTAQNVSAGAADFQQSVMSVNGMSRGAYHEGLSSGYEEGMWGMNQRDGSGVYSEFESRQMGGEGGIFDGMALPDHFLEQYYNQVTGRSDNLGVKDGQHQYDYEGQCSSAGSVGCCSLLENDNDLQFLDDLGIKFKTLAEVCGGKKVPDEVKPVVNPLPSASKISAQTSVSTLVNAGKMEPAPRLQPVIPKTEHAVVRKTTEHAQMVKNNTAIVKDHMTNVKTEKSNQNQMLLLPHQQPVYYTTTAPMLQPVHYVVQPQVQNTVLLAEAPAANLQSVVLVKDTQPGLSQGVIVQGQTVIPSRQVQSSSLVLMENSGVQGANLIQGGKFSGPPTMMVVEGKVPSGSLKVLPGNQTRLIQSGTLQSGGQTHLVQGGTLQSGGLSGSMKILTGNQTHLVQGGTRQSVGLSGSQKVLMVGEPTGSEGLLVQDAGALISNNELSGFQRVVSSKGSISPSMGPSTTTATTAPIYRKLVVDK